MKTVYNQKQVDFRKQPMFFGEALNAQLYLDFKYPEYDKLAEQMLSLFWRPQEVSLQKDISDWRTLSDSERHIFTSNLKYQTLLDSVQSRAPSMAYREHVSLPELEGALIWWEAFENIHSRSYAYIMKNVYNDPVEEFNKIMIDPRIIERAASVTQEYDKFIEMTQGDFVANEAVKRQLIKSLYTVNILEGIRFYVSFACTFAFAENKKMEGSAKIVSFILRDESKHFALTTRMINAFSGGSEGTEWKRIATDPSLLEEVDQIYDVAVNQEKVWADYLFKDGALIGLNAKLLHKYVEELANKRRRNVGLPQRYETNYRANTLPWMDNWTNSKGLQICPQETEQTQYLVGAIKQDALDMVSDFKL